MAPRPGTNSSEACGGCCGGIFLIPVLFFGLPILGRFWHAALQSRGVGPLELGFLICVSAGMIAAVGGGIYGIVGSVRALQKQSRPLTPQKVPLTWKQSPWFPPLKKRQVTANGRIRL